jgi:gamma-glutamylcyclotransferase (GGCT)/AIG2-like uncharacterized protein YtfP
VKKENFFAYGTLMCEDIFRMVTGCSCLRAEGILPGYQCLRIKDAPYPGLVPGQGAARGIIYFQLPAEAWPRLDLFEGKIYARLLLRINRVDNDPAEALAYVVRPQFEHLLERSPWDFQRFLSHDKQDFLRQLTNNE